MADRVINAELGLFELKVRLDRAAAVTAGAHMCAQRGGDAEALQMILELDLDVLLHEAQHLLAILSLRSRRPVADPA